MLKMCRLRIATEPNIPVLFAKVQKSVKQCGLVISLKQATTEIETATSILRDTCRKQFATMNSFSESIVTVSLIEIFRRNSMTKRPNFL